MSSSYRHTSTTTPASSEGSQRMNPRYDSQYHNNHNNHNHHVQSQLSASNSQARLEQLFDEQDHKRCSEGNRKALLAENLDQLRGLAKVLEADDWKYHNTNASNNSAGSFAWSSRVPPSPSTGGGSNHS